MERFITVQKCFIIFTSMRLISGQLPKTSTVQTPSGPVFGFQFTTSNGLVMDVFYGIPYGNKPDRFQKPVARTAWTSVLNVSSPGPVCPQASFGAPRRMDEDCLYVKVLRPSNISQQQSLPVIFWPPGGGFSVGGASGYDYGVQGANFVARNIIIVQPNYREGALGFWSTSTDANPGNWGMWDALLALSWTKTHIRAFGGNPDRIILMAQGAGAITNSLMTLSPQAVGLYHSAILFSGTLFNPWVNVPDSVNQERYSTFATLVGCDDASHSNWTNPATRGGIMNCIKSKPVADILRAQAAAAQLLNVPNQFWHPRIDGPNGIWPASPDILAKSRANIPIILGATFDEAAWFLYFSQAVFGGQVPINVLQLNQPQTVRDECRKQINYAHLSDTNNLIEACQWYYVDSNLLGEQPVVKSRRSPYFWLQQAIRIQSGLVYQAPAIKDATYYLQNNNTQVYVYSFDFIRNQSNLWKNSESFHNMDLIYIEHFLVGAYKATVGFHFTPDDLKVQQFYSDFVAGFAHHDDPSAFTPNVKWDPLHEDTGNQQHMSITANPTMNQYFHPEDVYFWNQAAPLVAHLDLENNDSN